MFTDQAQPDQAPHISVLAGILVGLAASLVQSLGLTLQRKSHLENEALPLPLRKKDRKRPLWVGGFLIFICSNLLGTIFQIGALPIVVLGPLGAVSLLFNALFAKFILGDSFSLNLALGTVAIVGGAVLIGIFGVVPEETHYLDELIRLYSRPQFIVWITLLSLSIIVVLSVAHSIEWALDRRLTKVHERSSPSSPSTPARRGSLLWRRRSGMRSKSAANSPGKYGAVEVVAVTDNAGIPSHGILKNVRILEGGDEGDRKPLMVDIDRVVGVAWDTPFSDTVERTKLVLGLAYGAASGTLSGLCLLFAKTGIDLLILTVIGNNQFGRFQAWLIVFVLIFAALLQLFYLNRALRLLGPTLVCPLAFCFYNIISIISGLIYFDQWGLLSSLQVGLVSLGTVILLSGVWVVSIKIPDSSAKTPSGGTAGGEEMEALLEHSEGETETEDEGEEDSDDQRVQWLPTGLTIGIGAASPGFALQPSSVIPRRRRSSVHQSRASEEDDEQFDASVFDLSSATIIDLEAAAEEEERRERRVRRGASISGALYVNDFSRALSPRME